MLIVVGLGNPGLSYKNTIHNMGFDCLDKVAKELKVSFKTKSCDARLVEIFVKGEKVILAKPQTYMNNSGDSVKQLIGKYNAKPEEILIIFDDVALPCGALRLRTSGSGGSHNGMKSVVAKCGENVLRLRVGVGAPPQNVPLMNYVLSKVNGEQKKVLDSTTTKASEAIIEYIATRNIEKIANKYNG